VSMAVPASVPSMRPEWQRRLLGPTGIALAFFWGLAEGTFFFIVPDVFLSLLGLLSLRLTWKHVASTLGGALLAGAILFHWAQIDSREARQVVLGVPFIRQTMFTRVDEDFRNHGLLAMTEGSVSGLPYKLYAVEAPRFFSRTQFLLATPPSRAFRFLLVWFAFGSFGQWMRKK
jgi:hypothetical protein